MLYINLEIRLLFKFEICKTLKYRKKPKIKSNWLKSLFKVLFIQFRQIPNVYTRRTKTILEMGANIFLDEGQKRTRQG